MRRVLFWLVVLVGLIAIIGALSNNPRHRTREPVSPSTSAATAQPPATPNVTHASLVGSLIAERSGSGLTISGMTNGLPAGTKMWVEIIHQPGGPKKPISGPQDDKVIIAVDGRFRANLSNRDGSVFRPGSYTIMITAYFNSGWQTVDVLRKAGVELDSQGRSSVRTDPKAIPESLDFETDDPEFPKVGRHLKILREVKLGQSLLIKLRLTQSRVQRSSFKDEDDLAWQLENRLISSHQWADSNQLHGRRHSGLMPNGLSLLTASTAKNRKKPSGHTTKRRRWFDT